MSPKLQTHEVEQSDQVRAFSRVFTGALGLLGSKPYDPDLNLLESRILFELSGGPLLFKEMVSCLSIDKGYLSRSVERLRKKGFIDVRLNQNDKREKFLSLTKTGEEKFRIIEAESHQRVSRFLEPMGQAKAHSFTNNLSAARIAANPDTIAAQDIEYRFGLLPGDIGWMIQRHGELYALEYGWNADFEVLVAEIVTKFSQAKEKQRQGAWIAEASGVRLGCVMLEAVDESTAKLRVLLVDPLARGKGVGSELVKRATGFAREKGFTRLELWTNDVLKTARRIYEVEGFKLEKSENHHSFGCDLVGEYWAKDLTKS